MQNLHSSITRREFHRHIAATAVLGAAALARPARAQSFPPGKYVDIHTHIGQEWGAKEKLTAKALLEWMDLHEIAQAVVLPLVNPESWDYPISTYYVLRETKPHRDRLIPFCAIDPRVGMLGAQEKRDQMKKYQDAGCKGFGEHKPGVEMADPRNIELFQACADVGFPMLFHLDNIRNTDKPGLPGLETVLKAVPNGIFIGHATGWWASISGGLGADDLQGYPEGKVAPGGAVGRLFDTYSNIYGDLSAGSGSNALSRDLEHGRDFCMKYADRLLFGTDYLEPGQDVRQFDVLDGFKLPAEVEGKIFRDNARKLLGLG